MAGIEAVIFDLDGTLFDHEASAAAGLHRWLRLTELAGPVIAAVELGVAKPDPRAFHAACAVLHTAPQHALYVGDDYDLDYLGARAAGMHAIHLDRAGLVEESCRSLETLLQAVALLDRR